MPRPSYEQHRATKAALCRRGSAVESETDADSLASYSTTTLSTSSYGREYFPSSSGYPAQRITSSSSHGTSVPYRSHGSSSLGFGPGSAHLRPDSLRNRTLSSTSRDGSDCSAVLAPQHQHSHGLLESSQGEPSRLRRLGSPSSPLIPSSPVSHDPWDLGAASEAKAGDHLHPSHASTSSSARDALSRARRLARRQEKERRRQNGTLLGDKYDSPLRRWLRWMSARGLSGWTLGVGLAGVGVVKIAMGLRAGRMPMTALLLEAGVWWSAVATWVIMEGRKGGRSWRTQMTGIMTVLMQPSLALIDTGHSQNHSVLLGLSLWTVILLSRGQDLLGCVAFSLALCIKLTGWYFAPAIGSYLAGKCVWLGWPRGAIHLAKLSVVTGSTVGLLFVLQFDSVGGVLGVIHRLFPFAYSAHEDKVADFRDGSEGVVEWRRVFSTGLMAKIATALTVLALLPTVILLIHTSLATRPNRQDSPTDKHAPESAENGNVSPPLVKAPAPAPPPTVSLLMTALFTSSLVIFLLSFQAEEKDILIPLMPLTIMMAMRGGSDGGGRTEDEVWEWGALVNNVGVFSMWPLLSREGQVLPYFGSTLLWNYIIGYNPLAVEGSWTRRLGLIVYISIALIHVLEFLPIPRVHSAPFPDVCTVLSITLYLGVLSMTWLWGMRKLLRESWAIAGLGLGRGKRDGVGGKGQK